MLRVGRVVRILPECVSAYVRLHGEIWPEVEAAIRAFGIRRYSIFLRGDLLFSYYELASAAEAARLDRLWMEDPACARWEALVAPMQACVDSGAKGTWAAMEEIFHMD